MYVSWPEAGIQLALEDGGPSGSAELRRWRDWCDLDISVTARWWPSGCKSPPSASARSLGIGSVEINPLVITRDGTRDGGRIFEA